MHDAVSFIYTSPHWALVFPFAGLAAYLSLSGRSLGATWDRLAYLTGRLTLFLAVFYIPLVFYTGTWQHYDIPKRFSFQFFVLVMLGSWWAVKGRLQRPRSPLLLPAAYFFLIMVLTTFGAVNMAESWETLVMYGAVLINMVLIGTYFRRPSDIRLVCVLINICTLAVVLYALAQWFDWTPIWRAIEGPNSTVFTRKPVSFMGNENYTAEFLNLAFPLAVSLLIYSWGHPLWMAMYSLVVCLTLIALLYIDCNATYMGFLAGFPVMALILISHRALPCIHRMGLLSRSSGVPVSLQDLNLWFRRIVFALILVVSVSAALLASFENPIRRRITTTMTWADTDGDHIPDGAAPVVFRLECMSGTLRTIYDNPVTGIGPGNFKVIHPDPRYESQRERKVLGEETLARKVHNDILYHAVEFGCFGMFGFIWMWVTALWCAFRSLRLLDWTGREETVLGPSGHPQSLDNRRFLFYYQTGAISGLLIALASANFGHTFVIPTSQVMFWFVAGSSVLIYQWARGEKTVYRPVEPGNRFSLAAVPSTVRWPVLLAVVLVLGSWNVRQLSGESHLRAGMSLQSYKQYKPMFEHFDAALRVWPYQMEIFYILGRYCIDASVQIEQVRKQGDDLVGQEIMASPVMTPERQKELRSNADEAVRTHLATYYGLDESEKTRIIDLGMRVLQTDLYLNPIYKWAHNNLGVLYDKRGLFEYSERSYDRVLKIDPEQVYAHYNDGLGYMRIGDYENARKSLERAFIADRKRSEVLQYLAYTFVELGDAEHAKEALDHYAYKEWDQKGVPWNPGPELRATLFRTYSNIGFQLAAEGKPEMAVDALIRAGNTGYQDASLRDLRLISEQLALNLLKLGRVDPAIAVYQQMLARDDLDNTTRRNLCFLLSRQGRNREALQAMQRVVHDEPHDWAAWYNCASLKAVIGTYDNASILADLRSAVERNRDEVSKQFVEDTLLREKLKGDPGLREILGEEIYLQVEKPTNSDEASGN